MQPDLIARVRRSAASGEIPQHVLLFQLRQTVRDFNPRSLGADIDVSRGFNPRVGIQRSQAKPDSFRMVVIPLQDR